MYPSKFYKCTGKFLFLLFFCFMLISLSDAAIKDQVYEKVLPNGLKVILLQNHTAPLVTFQVWYRVGSRNEEWGKTGLSHMLEHIMFKGTEKIAPEEFSKIIQENGGNSNAFTSNDFTAYFETLSVDKVQIGIDLESDRMQNLSLKEKDFLTERMVVMEERRLRTVDNPKSYLVEQMNATAFQTSPYHWPTIGWKEDIERFTLDNVKAYYRKYYNPANAFLVVVGDFDRDDLLSRIEKAFGPIPGGTALEQKKDIDALQNGERRVLVKREAELPYIVMSYHIPNLKNSDSYVLEVIAAIFSGGKSSRLYQNLVLGKRLVIEANADNSLLSHDPYLFSLSAEPLPDKQVEEVENALNHEIERLQKEPVQEHEIEKAKNQIEANFVYGQDSRFFQAMLLARHEIVSSWRNIDDYLPSIRKITPEDILRVANTYLIPDNRTVGILIPIPHEEKKPLSTTTPLRERMIR
jgi:zinc protease